MVDTVLVRDRGRDPASSSADGTTIKPARRSAVALGMWAALVAVAGGSLAGSSDLRGSYRVLLPVAVGAAVVVTAHRAQRLRWRVLLGIALLAAMVWAISLALVDGPRAITAPLESRYDYLREVPLVGDSPAAFLDTFTTRIRSYSTHVQGHPPGALLTFWALDRAGAGGAGWAAMIVITAGASSVAATMIALRDLAGETVARRAVPFLVLMPAAVWIATSTDALFLGVSAWGLSLFVLATSRSRARSDAYALAGGLLLGASLFLSYGVVPLAAVVLAVAVARRRLRPLAVAAIGVAGVVVVFASAGFWWADGLRATTERYAAGVARRRSYASSLITNIGAFALALGPAAAVAATRLRDRRVWLLAGGALSAVALADLSGLSKGEVERIWLPFVPWVLTACVTLAGRGWLALQAAAAVVVQVVLRSPW